MKIRTLFAVGLAGALHLNASGQVNHNHSLVLDGVDDFVTVPDTIPLRLAAGDFTFCAWIHLESYHERNSAIVFKRTGGSSVQGYVFSVGGYNPVYSGAPRRFFYQVIGSTGPFVPSTQDVPLDEWTHVAMVHHAAEQKAEIYINGELDVVQPNILIPGANNPTDLYIGRDSLAPQYFFHGMIDEVQFWSRALTPEEIRAFRHRKLSGREKDLIGYWSFKHGELRDESTLAQGGNGGATTDTAVQPTPSVTAEPAVSITVTNCMPTSVFELEYTTNLVEGAWTPVTREHRTLTDGTRIYSDPVIDPKRYYRLKVLDEE